MTALHHARPAKSSSHDAAARQRHGVVEWVYAPCAWRRSPSGYPTPRAESGAHLQASAPRLRCTRRGGVRREVLVQHTLGLQESFSQRAVFRGACQPSRPFASRAHAALAPAAPAQPAAAVSLGAGSGPHLTSITYREWYRAYCLRPGPGVRAAGFVRAAAAGSILRTNLLENSMVLLSYRRGSYQPVVSTGP